MAKFEDVLRMVASAEAGSGVDSRYTGIDVAIVVPYEVHVSQRVRV